MSGFLLGFIFMLLGLYSALTRKPGHIARKNLYGLLTVEQYDDYVHKVGMIYVGIGFVVIIANLIFDTWEVPKLLQLFLLLCLTYPLFSSFARLNKRYFEVSEPNFLKNNENHSDPKS